MSEEDSVFYMAIDDPVDFRRELLGSSKTIIQLLQRNEHLKDLRTKKIEKIFQLSQLMSEITMLVGKLKNVVPQAKLRNIPKSDFINVEKPASANIQQNQSSPNYYQNPFNSQNMQSSQSKSYPMDSNELRQLQNELHLIEQKLGMLK